MKKLLILLAIPALLVAGFFVYLHFSKNKDLAPLVTKKLQKLVREGSDGLYSLELDSVDLDIINTGIVLYNARLVPDSARLNQMIQQQTAPDNVYKLSVKSFELKGLSPKTLLNQKDISLSVLRIHEPIVEIFHQNRQHAAPVTSDSSFYQKIAREVNSFKLSDFLLDKISLHYYDQDKDGHTTKLSNLSCHFSDIQIDASTQHDTTRFLYAKEATVIMNNYEQVTKDGLYRFAVDSLSMIATTRKVRITNLSLKPVGKKEDFSSKLKLRQDRYDLHIASITASNVDWFNLLLNNTMIADEVVIQNGTWEIFSDQRIPPSNKSMAGSFPHQKITQLLMPVYLKDIKVRDFTIYYQEFNTLSGQKGSVEFHHANGTVHNVTNAVDKIKLDPYMEIKASAAFMNSADMDATLRFDLAHAREGNFTVDAKIGSMNVVNLNKATIPLGLFDVKSGQLKQFTFHMQGNNRTSTGYTSVTYSDLKVDAMKKDEDKPGEVKKKGLATFIANNFMLAKSSPDKGNKPIEQHVSYTKTPQQTFWAFIWKTLLEGVRPSIKGQKDKKDKKDK